MICRGGGGDGVLGARYGKTFCAFWAIGPENGLAKPFLAILKKHKVGKKREDLSGFPCYTVSVRIERKHKTADPACLDPAVFSLRKETVWN